MAVSHWVTGVVAGCVGGAMGGLFVWLFGAEGPGRASLGAEPAAHSAAAQRRRAVGGDDVEDRLGRMEQQVASLRSRSAAREALAAYNQALREQQGQAGSGNTLTPVIDQDDPTFELAVREVVGRVRKEQEQEREGRRALSQQERARRLTELLAEQLRLNESQRQQVERALLDEQRRFRELWDPPEDAGVERPVTRREWRERADLIRAQTDRQLEQVLDEEQLGQFREIREEEGFGPGWGRRRRDRGR
jgi:hypothetical protein